MWKYLKTVDFINTKIIMFKINLFNPIEYRRRIRITWPWTWRSRSFEINGTWKLLNGLLVIHNEYMSQIDGLSAILHNLDFIYHCPFASINCRAFALEGVYVYKLAFFFWLSPRTYHFLFEKRLIIDWRYFWRNIALSLILERSPDYPLKNRNSGI